MLPGEAGINVRKTARYASKDCDPLHFMPKPGSSGTWMNPSRGAMGFSSMAGQSRSYKRWQLSCIHTLVDAVVRCVDA